MSDYRPPFLDSLLADNSAQSNQALLPVLQAVQAAYGFISEPMVREIGLALNVPLADIYGVIDFYSLLHSHPTGKTIIHVCNDPACAIAGSEQVLDSICRHLKVQPGGTSRDGEFSVERAPCLGLCDHAPAVLVGDKAYGKIDPHQAADIFRGTGSFPVSIVDGDIRLLTANCGKDHPTSLDEYEKSGGYQGFKKAIVMKPAEVIAEIKASGLVGRGGAAFPSGVKLEGCAAAPGETRYVVCNADESEPGTFKDRVILESDPHCPIEGMLIAGLAIGARQGFIYVRGEYPHIPPILEEALSEARSAGYLGKDILNSGFDFDIQIVNGAGAYICGEETALFESMDGKRGFPRMKPPFPTTHGLFGQPTVINNVETLCNFTLVLNQGVTSYRSLGTEKSTGPKLFCVSGDVARPGLYEAPFGITLRHLVYDLAGGINNGESLGAILVGGAAGAFATEKDLDVKLSFEDLHQVGLPLGSGVVMVFNRQRDLRQIILRLARFFVEESCGKCYPCQLGTQRQYEIIERLASGRPLPGDAQRLADIGLTMTDASLCGLGQTAASAVLSALKWWPSLFEAET